MIQLRDVSDMSLGDLATKRTMYFFKILELSSDFLTHPVSEWSRRDDYKKAQNVALHLKVVNDHAERAVKLMSDYNRCVTKNGVLSEFVIERAFAQTELPG